MITKTCPVSGKKFTITGDDLRFYEKMGVPEPTLCPEERQRNRFCFRNERTLFKRACDGTGKSIVSCFPPEARMPVYDTEYWWGDGWSGLDYGRDFDFSRPFFEQFVDLYNTVPVVSRYALFTENSPYVNAVAHVKNSYICHNADYIEDCYYVTNGTYMKDCVDCYSGIRLELCYECLDCDGCYNLSYSHQCQSCSDSSFLQDCRRCKHCIGCCNLTDKEYYIWNQKVSPEAFEEAKEKLKDPTFLQSVEKQFESFQIKYPKKYYFGYSCENFNGASILHAKDSHHVFCIDNVENVSYGSYLFKVKNARDYDIYGDNAEWIYYCLANGGNVSNQMFCIYAWNGSHDNTYSHLLSGTHDCFGCSGLKNQKYCILNKQYTKEAYFELKKKIIKYMKESGEWGHFFPIEMSPWAYNQTVAQIYFPLEKEEAISRGYQWKPDVEVVSSTDSLVVNCAETGRPFLIQKEEARFYKIQGIIPPVLHPEVRHKKRMKKIRPYTLWDRECGECSKKIRTNYSPERPEKVLCEECYSKVIN